MRTATTSQKATNPPMPSTIPRSSPIACPGPCSREANTASTEASTGSAASIPPSSGPRRLAAALSRQMSPAVVTIRAASPSDGGSRRSTDGAGGRGMAR